MTALIASLVAAGTLLLASAAAAQPADAIERGRKVYAEQRCQMCHAIDGKGNRKGSLDGVGSRLTREEIRAWMVDAPGMTAKTKATRKPAMKSYPNLPAEDLDALVAYLHSLKK